MSEPKRLHKDINHEGKKTVVTKPCPKKKKPVTAGKVSPTRMSVIVVFVFILKSTRLIHFTSIEIFCQKWGI